MPRLFGYEISSSSNIENWSPNSHSCACGWSWNRSARRCSSCGAWTCHDSGYHSGCCRLLRCCSDCCCCCGSYSRSDRHSAGNCPGYAYWRSCSSYDYCSSRREWYHHHVEWIRRVHASLSLLSVYVCILLPDREKAKAGRRKVRSVLIHFAPANRDCCC